MHPRIAEYAATPARRRTIVIVGVTFEVFVGLLVLTYYMRAKTPGIWPVPFQFGSLLMVFSMAMAAVCASITMVVGAHSAAKNKTEEAVRWIAIAISSWLVFLFLECVEWANLVFIRELGPKTPFGSTFLAATGAHWIAAIACTVWFTFAVADIRRRDILAAALYSHFLALWWIVLVCVLYLPNMNPLENF